MIKKIGMFIALILVGISSIYLYLAREQSIKFYTYMPQEFNVCGDRISIKSLTYRALEKWFKLNENGWQNTPVSYVPNYIFSSNSMVVNILPSSVVVNYQVGSSWHQVIKSAKTDELIAVCE